MTAKTNGRRRRNAPVSAGSAKHTPTLAEADADSASWLDAGVGRFIRLVPLAAALALPPLLVRRAFVGLPLEAFGIWYKTENIEYYAWWKAVAVMASALWMAFVMAWCFLAGWRPRRPGWGAICLIPLAATLVSALLSDFPDTVYVGFASHFEGVYTCACYLFIGWYAAEMVRSRGEAKFLLWCLLFAGCVNAALGIAQLFGHDFWFSDLGLYLMGTARENLILMYRTGFGYGALANQNAFSRFMAMTCIAGLTLAFAGSGKASRAAAAACAAVAAWSLTSNYTRGGVVALAGGVAFLAVVAFRTYMRSWNGWRGLLSAALSVRVWLVAGLVAAAFGVGATFSSRLFPHLSGLLAKFDPENRAFLGNEQDTRLLTGVELRDNVITLHAATNESYQVWRKDGGGWSVTRKPAPGVDAAAELATDLGTAGGWRRWRAPVLGAVTVSQETPGERIVVDADGISFELYDKKGTLFGLDGLGQWRSAIRLPRVVLFGDRIAMFSGRGYVWSRGLGTVADRPWFGSGPDTFCLVFPHDEIVAKRRLFSIDTLVDKADGTWVDVLVSVGWIGALAWLAPLVYAAGRVRRALGEPVVLTAAAVMVVYCLGGMVTNSTPGVTPTFWCLCGLAVGLAGDAVADKDA